MDRFNDGADVDDILVCSWGYDQTNVDFYKVVRRTKASAWLVKVGQKLVPGSEGFMSEQVLPDPDNVIAWGYTDERYKPRMKRVKTPEWNDGKAVITMTSYSSAFPYDGRPEYQSHYA